MFCLDLSEAIETERVGVDLRLCRHRRAGRGDRQANRVLRIIRSEDPGLAAVGAGLQFWQRHSRDEAELRRTRIFKKIGIDDALTCNIDVGTQDLKIGSRANLQRANNER